MNNQVAYHLSHLLYEVQSHESVVSKNNFLMNNYFLCKLSWIHGMLILWITWSVVMCLQNPLSTTEKIVPSFKELFLERACVVQEVCLPTIAKMCCLARDASDHVILSCIIVWGHFSGTKHKSKCIVIWLLLTSII